MEEPKQGKYRSPVIAIATGIRDLLKKKVRAGQVREEDRLNNKNVLITGASSGLGYAVARHLAKKGANLYMACRSGIPEKGEKIKKITGSEKVWMLPVDLSDINSINELVFQIREMNIRFDVVICNAAIVPKVSRQTKQGLEEMFMVNYLAKYALIRLLLDRQCIRFNPHQKPRFIFVASESHRNPEEFNWDGFGKYQSYGMGRTVELYGYYKLLLTTFACELSRRLNYSHEPQASVFALCPGPVNTRIAREAPIIFQPLLKLVFALFFRSPAKAAEPVVYFAVSQDVTDKSFDYLHLMTRKEIDRKAADADNGRRLWEISEEFLKEYGLKFKQN